MGSGWVDEVVVIVVDDGCFNERTRSSVRDRRTGLERGRAGKGKNMRKEGRQVEEGYSEGRLKIEERVTPSEAVHLEEGFWMPPSLFGDSERLRSPPRMPLLLPLPLLLSRLRLRLRLFSALAWPLLLVLALVLLEPPSLIMRFSRGGDLERW